MTNASNLETTLLHEIEFWTEECKEVYLELASELLQFTDWSDVSIIGFLRDCHNASVDDVLGTDECTSCEG